MRPSFGLTFSAPVMSSTRYARRLPRSSSRRRREGIAAGVLGHEKQTLSYGLYSSGSSTKQKLDALSKVGYPGALGKP